jgi:hypothetical protein
MRSLFFLVFILLSISSSGDEVESETVWTELKTMLNCFPDKIKIGETLTISLGNDHGKELAVFKHKDDSWHFMVVGSPPDDMKSLMTPSEFKESRIIEIKPDTTAYRWSEEGKNEKVFSEPGKYSFYVSEILESETGGYVCHVQVVDR